MRSRRRRPAAPAPIRMSYGEAGAYLTQTLERVRKQMENGTLTQEQALRQWDEACEYTYAATSQEGYRPHVAG